MPESLSPSQVRSAFSAAMSDMYRTEVPAYGTLLDLVARINAEVLERQDGGDALIESSGGLARLSAERHGAIRVGTAEELRMIRRAFALMGMQPVGYYDLSLAGLPVHSTAFRPVDEAALAANPFRVFCSLLRLDLITDETLRREADEALARRQIFTDEAVALIERAEAVGGVEADMLDDFIAAVLMTFKWRSEANVDAVFYDRVLQSHRLIADIVCFKGPHINHLTPRTLDIDAVQAAMPGEGINPKAVVEGPPARDCPILLRQTAFKALSESVLFPAADGTLVPGRHTARFGEIEQRGVALTPKGRALYDRLLATVRELSAPASDGSNAEEYTTVLESVFADFPDDWETLRREKLAYFRYRRGDAPAPEGERDPDRLVELGVLVADPVTYEDFLPVSAAGIFQSNLGDDVGEEFSAEAMQAEFEAALGAEVADPFDLYATLQQASIEACLRELARQTA